MNNHVHPVFADILDRIAMTPTVLPQAEAIDRAMLEDKKSDGYARREEQRALRLQQQWSNF